MSDMELLPTLQEIEFLQGFADEHLRKLASLAEVVDLPKGHTVFREGDLAKEIYLITLGKVALEICAPGIGCRRIHTVGEGELLGWSPVLEQPRLSATARTLTEAQAVKFSGSQILTLCEHDPRFGYEFMRRAAGSLAKRLSAARMQMLDVYGSETPAEAD